jgi:hypothetical protein
MNCWSECFSFVFTLVAILLQISAALIPRIYLLNGSKIQIGLLESCAVDSKCVVHVYMLDWFIKNLVLVIMSSIFLSLSMIFQIFECFCKNSKLNKFVILLLNLMSIITTSVCLFNILNLVKEENFKNFENIRDNIKVETLAFGISFYVIIASILSSIIATVLTGMKLEKKKIKMRNDSF